jgi:hypothetical protein
MKKILLAVPVLLLFFTACEKDKEVSDNSYTPFIPATIINYLDRFQITRIFNKKFAN